MMTSTNLLYARAAAAAIAAAVAISPTYAAPKPIVDLSKSPAISDEAKTAPAPAAAPDKEAPDKIGPFDEQTAIMGGGALALLVLGGAAIAINRRRHRQEDEEAWHDELIAPVAEQPAVEQTATDELVLDRPAAAQAVAEPRHATAAAEPSAFAWGKDQPCDQPSDDGSDRCPGESWVERAKRGPSPANPSASLKHRLGRAAFFDKREREVAAGQAAPLDPDAGLPEAMVEEQERESA